MSDVNLAVVVRPGGDLRVEERPMPVPASDEALVRIAYGGICGSDLHYWRHGAAGESILRGPMVLGHEVSGTVVHGAPDGSGPPAGSDVAVHPGTAGEDPAVRFPADRPNLAPGTTYLGSAARYPHTDGAFARFVALPSRMLRVLPAGVTLRQGAIAEPAAVAWHAVRRAGSVTGCSVLVVGAGPIGALVVAASVAAGAALVTVTDLHESARERAVALGARAAVTSATEIDDLQADVAFEASGSPAGIASAIRGTMRGGRVVLVGLPATGPQPVPIGLAITRELDLLGSFRFTDAIDDVLAAIAAGTLPVDRVVTHEFPVERAVEAFEIASDSRLSGKVLIRL